LSRTPFLDSGPLWFVQVLLYVSLGYALWDWLRRGRPGRAVAVNGWHLVGVAAVIASASFLVRLEFPARSQQILDLHLWQWPQCLGLFALGVEAGRRGWFARIPADLRRRCAWIGLATALLVAVLIGSAGELEPFEGGTGWQAIAAPVTEGVICVCAAIALTDLFRDRTDHGRLSAELGRAAYAAFILQAPVLVGLALALQDSSLPPLARFAVVAPLGIVLSFALGIVLTRLPGMRRIL
jgi:peptidoglycan/LPS O-acetylase OafA/YrhL